MGGRELNDRAEGHVLRDASADLRLVLLDCEGVVRHLHGRGGLKAQGDAMSSPAANLTKRCEVSPRGELHAVEGAVPSSLHKG